MSGALLKVAVSDSLPHFIERLRVEAYLIEAEMARDEAAVAAEQAAAARQQAQVMRQRIDDLEATSQR